MSSSQKPTRNNKGKEMADFVVDDLQYPYEGDSHQNDNLASNRLQVEEPPMIEQKRVEMKVNLKKIEAIFAEDPSGSDSQDDLLVLMAKQKQAERRKTAKLQEDKLDVSKIEQILESSKAAKPKPLPPVQKSNNSLSLPNSILTQAQIQRRFKQLPDSVNVYITEIYENHSDRRKLTLFGITEQGDRLSIQIKDVNKCIYFIMRQDQEDQTKIQEQIRKKLKQSGIDQYDGELLTMNYVFQIEGIPRGEILAYRVKYPFTQDVKNPPQPDWQGQTYKYVIGTTYSALQLFVVKNKIKGPQWITLEKKYLEVNSKVHNVVSLPVQLFYPDDIQAPKQIKVPKLKVLSFAVKATKPEEVEKNNIFPYGVQRDKPLIYAISIEYHPSYNIESKTKNLKLQSIVFCLSSLGNIPNQSNNTRFIKCQTEASLLSHFFEAIQGFDPDILVCHDATMALDMIVTRADMLNMKEKAKLGRLGSNRIIAQMPNMKQRQMLILAGRLLVDTFLHAKDLLKSVDYSISFLSKDIQMGIEIQDISQDTANSMLATGELMKLLHNCSDQSQGAFLLMNHLEIVQLSRQLTNICGNLWRRSLDNARAERNQYLMMHVCENKNYIIPDKFYRQKDDDGKKQKYEGGYVIEPEKDLYNQYILLLDFNSLYPSIIREYNICFSKVKRNLLPLNYYYKPRGERGNKNVKHNKIKQQSKKVLNCEELLQEIEQISGVKAQQQSRAEEQQRRKIHVEPIAEEFRKPKYWGFLPQLIDYIVKKRTEYKSKMAQLASLPAAEFEKRQDQYLAFEVTQKSYKLVANSIYGCLGFQNSRFYARDLAALITEKGREALKKAKHLVEKSGRASVIYGDTDSLMLKINLDDNMSEFEKITLIHDVATRLKIEINKQYTNRMLEIDVDGVFKPLNLIAKKKYMAKKLVNFDKVRLTKAAPIFTVQYKGIQVAKRDGCEKSRKVIKDIFDIILNNMGSMDDASTLIYDYFQNLHNQMISMNTIKQYKNYLLAKQLNKHPSQYKNGAENLPHIRVAKHLIENGEKAEKLINHAIYYLIVQTDKQKASVADKAVDQASFVRSLKTINPMKIDINHYKIHEILPPIIRVLANIKSINVSYIREKFNIPKSFSKQMDKLEDDERDIQYQQNNYQAVRINYDSVINNALGDIECGGRITVDHLKPEHTADIQIYRSEKEGEKNFFFCDKKLQISKNNTIVNKCTDQHCSHFIDADFEENILNHIVSYIFTKSTNFFTPEYRCRKCSKVWKAQIQECCPNSKFQANMNISEMHNTLYILSEVVGFPKGQSSLLRNYLDEFFEKSSFETIQTSFFNNLKFKPSA